MKKSILFLPALLYTCLSAQIAPYSKAYSYFSAPLAIAEGKDHKVMLAGSYYFFLIDSTGNPSTGFDHSLPNSIPMQIKDMIATSDGGYLMCGTISTHYTSWVDQAMLMKTDSMGNLLWARKFRKGMNNWDFTSVCETSDSGYAASGVSSNRKIHIVKTDRNGVPLWSIEGTDSAYYKESYTLRACPDGGVFFTSYEWGRPAPDYDMYYLSKFSSTGAFEWGKSTTSFMIEVIPHQSAYLGIGYSPGGFLLFHMDSSSSTISAMGVTGTPSPNHRNRIHSLQDGGCLFTPSDGGFYGAVMRFDSLDQLMWAKSLSNYSGDAVPLNDGGFLFTGTDPIFLVRSLSIPSFCGVNRLDSAGNGAECVIPSNLQVGSVTFSVNPDTLNFISGVWDSAFTFSLDSAQFSVVDSCVDFGGARESESASIPMECYPNPSNGLFSLEAEEPFRSIMVFDMNGRVVRQYETHSAKKVNVDARNLPPGMYMIQAEFQNVCRGNRLIQLQN